MEPQPETSVPPKRQIVGRVRKWLDGRVGKWLGGVAATVVGGLLLAWLTTGGGPFDPRSADISIDALGPLPRAVGQTPAAYVVVRNKGESTARRCEVVWSPFTESPDDGEAWTTEFSLPPGDSKEFKLEARHTPYSEKGEVSMAAKLTCEGEESPPVTKSLTVG